MEPVEKKTEGRLTDEDQTAPDASTLVHMDNSGFDVELAFSRVGQLRTGTRALVINPLHGDSRFSDPSFSEDFCHNYRRRRNALPYSVESVAEVASRVYSELTERAELEPLPGSVFCLLAEDETAVNPLPQWDRAQDAVVGYCGRECEEKKIELARNNQL